MWKRFLSQEVSTVLKSKRWLWLDLSTNWKGKHKINENMGCTTSSASAAAISLSRAFFEPAGAEAEPIVRVSFSIIPKENYSFSLSLPLCLISFKHQCQSCCIVGESIGVIERSKSSLFLRRTASRWREECDWRFYFPYENLSTQRTIQLACFVLQSPAKSKRKSFEWWKVTELFWGIWRLTLLNRN